MKARGGGAKFQDQFAYRVDFNSDLVWCKLSQGLRLYNEIFDVSGLPHLQHLSVCRHG